MHVGSLRKHVVIERLTVTQDGPDMTETWKQIAFRWAEIAPLTGRELMEANQTESRESIRIRMRPFDGLTTKDRITHDGRTFHIGSVADVEERGRMMELMCTESS